MVVYLEVNAVEELEEVVKGCENAKTAIAIGFEESIPFQKPEKLFEFVFGSELGAPAGKFFEAEHKLGAAFALSPYLFGRKHEPWPEAGVVGEQKTQQIKLAQHFFHPLFEGKSTFRSGEIKIPRSPVEMEVDGSEIGPQVGFVLINDFIEVNLTGIMAVEADKMPPGEEGENVRCLRRDAHGESFVQL